MNTCKTCRFWSDRLARSCGGGPVEAVCLGNGPQKGKYVSNSPACEAWADDLYGPIDAVGNEGAYSDEMDN